jgi:hypothetical protein
MAIQHRDGFSSLPMSIAVSGRFLLRIVLSDIGLADIVQKGTDTALPQDSVPCSLVRDS